MYNILLHLQQSVMGMKELINNSGTPEMFQEEIEEYLFWIKHIPKKEIYANVFKRLEEMLKKQKEIKTEEEMKLRESLDMAVKRQETDDIYIDTMSAFEHYAKRVNDYLSEEWKKTYRYCGNMNVKLSEKEEVLRVK